MNPLFFIVGVCCGLALFQTHHAIRRFFARLRNAREVRRNAAELTHRMKEWNEQVKDGRISVLGQITPEEFDAILEARVEKKAKENKP